MKQSCATPGVGETGLDGDPSAPWRVWVATDGRAGNEQPAKALGEAVLARLAATGGGESNRRPVAPLEVVRLAFRPGAEMLPAAIWDRLGPNVSLNALADGGGSLAGPAPDLIIGAGRRSGPIVSAVRTLNFGREGRPSCRAAQILWPQMPLQRFDRVYAPRHDRIPKRAAEGAYADRLRRTLGALNAIDPDVLAPVRARPDPRLDALPRPLIGVLVGGRSGSARFGEADGEALSEALTTLGAVGAGLAATPSRRTPKKIAERLAETVRAAGGFWWEGDGDNPYRAILAKADALLVTADSVNMISEAASTGRPVYVAPVSGLSAKLRRFHDAIRAADHVRDLAGGLERGRLDEWRPARLSETAAAAQDLTDLLRAGDP